MADIFDFSIWSKLLKGDRNLDIIMGMPDMNNQKRQKTVSNKTRYTLMAARLSKSE